MGVVAYVPDLMDRSRVAAAGVEVSFVAGPEALAAAAAGADVVVVVVDLGRPGVVEVLPQVVATGARVLGFGSHVDRATLRAAAEAGCEAMARSRFFAGVDELLGP
ncbi:MAG: hypothetical protein ACRDZ9_03615 [Acidimicrobiales bacterium]